MKKMKIEQNTWKSFGKFIKEQREDKGLSQAELISKTELSTTVVTDMEGGYRPSSRKTLTRVAKVLGYTSANSLLLAAGYGHEDKWKKIVAVIRQSVLDDAHISQLPSLFEDTIRLPIVDVYVELYLTKGNAQKPNVNQLVQHKTIAEKRLDAEDRHYATRLSASDALDDEFAKRVLILGDPGTGKSSLLRKIALDISQGVWQTYELAFFVEVRSFWLDTKKTKPSLIDYTMDRVLAGIKNLNIEDQQEFQSLLIKNSEKIVFLIDGLDEIADDEDAVRSIYGELQKGSFNWIATSRPAGLVRAPNELRRYNIAELSEDGIEALITNWVDAAFGVGKPDSKDKILAEIFASNALVEMASNPFLLTAILFIKSLNFNEALPQTRIALYETLINKITDQARLSKKDNAILDKEAVDKLSVLSFSLFEREGGALQLFERDDWGRIFPDALDILDKKNTSSSIADRATLPLSPSSLSSLVFA